MSDRAGHQMQMNLSVYPDLVDEIEALAERYEWSKREVVTVAVRALKAMMDAHEAYAAQRDDDIAALYMRLAAEMPAGFVEVPKEGVRVGRAADLPAVMVDNRWLVFPDRETGNLLAEEQGGERRIARIVDGEIKPLRLPTSEEVALN
jgi:hypothetical protein